MVLWVVVAAWFKYLALHGLQKAPSKALGGMIDHRKLGLLPHLLGKIK